MLMKLNFEEDTTGGGGTALPATHRGGDSAKGGEPKGFRRLKFNELVSIGDFVQNESCDLEPWDGPRGFQAGSFVKPIYRPERKRSIAPKIGSKKRT